MLYICRLLAHNAKCKVSLGFGGYCVVAINKLVPMSPFLVCSQVTFCCRSIEDKWTNKQNENDEQKRPQQHQHEQLEPKNEQKPQVNSKHFNVNWSNYISKLIQANNSLLFHRRIEPTNNINVSPCTRSKDLTLHRHHNVSAHITV